jgi:hypothetical protein
LLKKKEGNMKKKIRILLYFSLMVVLLTTIASCADAGPADNFDVTGVWQEEGGNSSVEFTEGGGYKLVFNPGLSDGTTKFEGESYTRVDNGHLTFIVVMGRGTLDIITVEASISSDNVMKFKLDGKTYKFTME